MRKTLTLIFLFVSIFAKAQYYNDSLFKSFTNDWLGTPYKFGGKTKKGIDCSSFNKVFYDKVFNMQIENVCNQQYKQSKRISIKDLIFGDLVFFYSKTSPSKWHCGVYIGDNKFIHSSSSNRGVQISNLEESSYKKRFKSGGRIL